jgi:DNA-binding beta-propeller fold protein YncE
MKRTIILFILVVLSVTASKSYAFKAAGFSNPYGVAIDAKTNFIYVSNVNGAPDQQDKNGFISRLKGDGTIDNIRFISASDKVPLNAPTGMAVAQDKLYVTDINKLHAFDLSTGKFLFDVNFGDLPIQHFYDVILGPDGLLYLADGPGNTVYKIDIARQHEVTTFASGEVLGQPHGITWFSGRQVFAIAGSSSGNVIAYDKEGERQTYPAIFLRTLEGITADDAGNMYVASTSLSAIYRIASNFGLNTFKLGVKSPAGLAYQKAGNQLIASFSETGTVETLPISEKEVTAVAAPLPPAKEEVKEPAKAEVKEPTKEEVKEPAKAEVKEPAKEEVKEPAKVEVKEPTKVEVTQPAKEEVKEPVKEERKEPAKDTSPILPKKELIPEQKEGGEAK